MIVPQFWAEAREQHKQSGKQVTVRRFGWSDISQEEAQTNADQRCHEALKQILSGEKLERSETKAPYNGASGLPIREEIISRHGDTIISRNSYGALCLNTPNVLFVDIDYKYEPGFKFTFSTFIILELCAFLTGYLNDSKFIGISLAILSLLFCSTISAVLYQSTMKLKGGLEKASLDRIDRFLQRHPDWNLRLYKTPAGMRILVTHRTFDSDESSVQDCFDSLGTDPMYVMMCRNQRCFRARVSPKPWRIGIDQHMRPRPGHWPVAPERLPLRNAWIAKYEEVAVAYASCSFIGSKGNGTIQPEVAKVIDLHDHLCRANGNLPIA